MWSLQVNHDKTSYVWLQLFYSTDKNRVESECFSINEAY